MAQRSFLPKSSAPLDPALAALFASSAGPVQPAKKPRYSGWVSREQANEAPRAVSAVSDKSREDDSNCSGDGGQHDQSSDSSDEALDGADSTQAASQAEALSKLVVSSEKHPRKRKRKQVDELDDIERKHMEQVADHDDEAPAKRHKMQYPGTAAHAEDEGRTGNLIHESLRTNLDRDEVEKASRTVFLSNVSTDAVSSKSAKKQLLAHLSSVLDNAASPPQSVESLRFRSVPVATAAMPKRAAVITQAVMDTTTKSTNAYAVYSDTAAARAAASRLNGTIVLDRHLRVDSVAHPSPVDHRRCVFIGNLGFVDDETVINVAVDEDGNEKTEKRKRTKTPMDVEEGLWRTFGQRAGKVENVRVIRDQATRVGKGIAYVQFYDANSVESAILLDGKKFPPLLPRTLRVNRCKAPHKTLRAVQRSNKARAVLLAGVKSKSIKYVRKRTDEERTSAGRAAGLLGRAGGARAVRHREKPQERAGKPELKSPEEIVFEGQRASVKDGKPRDLKHGRVKKPASGLSNNKKRQAARSASWRKKGRT